MVTQRCPRCTKDLPAESYHPDKWGKTGHYCRSCVLDYRREWRKARGQRTRAEHLEAIRRWCGHSGCDQKPTGTSTYCTTHRPAAIPSETYRAVHKRVGAARGKATGHACARCDGRAEHWAYDHADTEEVTGPTDRGIVVAYSLDPDHYLPLCISCHVKLDNGDGSTYTYDGSQLQAANEARRIARTAQPKRVSNW